MSSINQNKTNANQALTGSATQIPQMVPLSSLLPHPRQVELFGDITSDEVKALAKRYAIAASIPPIEVSTGNVIIVGYAQYLAYKHMGNHSVPAIVRDDLLDEAAVVKRLLVVGMEEPGLPLLTLARCYMALQDNARKLLPHEMAITRSRACDYLCGRFPNISRETGSRYCRLLQTPIEVQHALTNGQLCLKELEAVYKTSPETRQEIADEIRGGAVPREVVQRHIVKPKHQHKETYDAVRAMARDMKHWDTDLDGRLEEVRGWPLEDIDLLVKWQARLGQIYSQLKYRSPEEAEAALYQRLGEFAQRLGKNGEG